MPFKGSSTAAPQTPLTPTLSRPPTIAAPTAALSFEVSVGSGADARVRKSYVAYSPAGGPSTYSVAQVEQVRGKKKGRG